MSEEQIIDPASVPMADKKLAPGFKRNMTIIGGAIVVAILMIGVSIFIAKGKLDSSKGKVAATSIPGGSQSVTGSKPAEITPADEARLGRVQTAESEQAQIKKDTYIPQEMPLKTEAFRPPDASSSGPGNGYSYRTGETAPPQGPQGPPVDVQRDAMIKSGIEKQLMSIVLRNEPPVTQSATFYVPPAGVGAQAVQTGAAASTSTTAAAATVQYLIKGLTVAGARLVSPLDTAKSSFVTAEITTGPLAGAYLLGQGKMVSEEGVLMTFTRMKFNGEDYAVNVTGLDNATSSDAMGADIDRKLLARYVMPVVFTTFQAYLSAVSQVGQTIVATPGGVTTVVTPSAAGRQAAAAGLSAGVGKAGQAFGTQTPSAYMPIDSSIGLLFLDSVPLKAKK